MGRQKKKRTKASIDAERKRKRLWARRQKESSKVDAVDAKIDAKTPLPEIKTIPLTVEELNQPCIQAVDETFKLIINKIRERAKNGEKTTAAELSLLDKMKLEAIAASANAVEARVIAQDQINVVLQSSRPKALQVALEILDDKTAPAAVRLEAAKFTREWSDDEEPPEEPVELYIVQSPNITSIDEAKCV